MTKTYCSNIIFECKVQNAECKMQILTENGYIKDGMYHYFVKDYLGNNRLVLNEYGMIVQKNNYYPFGMTQLVDAEQQDAVPYKFSGKELESEGGLNLYDFSARFYDASTGRFGQIDPMSEKYYPISPYAYCGNNPTRFVDLNGDTITTTIVTNITNADGTQGIRRDSYYYGKDANGNFGFIGADGQIYSGDNQYVNDLTSALNLLQTGGDAGNSLVNNLMESTNTVEIAYGTNGVNNNILSWQPSVLTSAMNTGGNSNRPAFIGLGHEMAHIQDAWNGTKDKSTWFVSPGGKVVSNSEKYATHIENQLRAENGIPLRTHYANERIDGVGFRGYEPSRIIDSKSRSLFYQENGSRYVYIRR
ncbi:hypothetical protein FACS1894178_6210 [Bacteroidia bacterium]|nr:hypothetical protein FACS1894178_6210 [Bacteroidia bacterium]